MSLQLNENNPDDLFSFSGSVGRSADNDRTDVIKAQALLANAGYYDLPRPGMPTGWPGGGLTQAVIQFQKDHGLDPDGILLPMPRSGVSASGEGETLGALKGRAAASSSPRTARSCMSRHSAPGPTSSTPKSVSSPMPSTMRSPRKWRCISAAAGAVR